MIPGSRDVRGNLDRPTRSRCVVACPPHPQMGGSRHDSRLRAISTALECACLRFNYGSWDEGSGELADTRAALAWATENYESVGLVGYSFGGCLALVAAADESRAGQPPAAVAALAPAAQLASDIDATAAVSEIACPVGIVYGERDTTVDAEAVADHVTAAVGTVKMVQADHYFLGQETAVAKLIADIVE